MDIRLDVIGIVKFKALDTILGHFNIVDIESYRECQGYFSAASKTVDIPQENQELLNRENENIDELFTKSSIFTETIGEEIEEKIRVSTEGIPTEKMVDREAGAYNVVFVKLREGVSLNEGLKKINRILKDEHLEVRAVSWKKAFGLIGSMATIIKGALFGFVILLFIVAVIIIINTLTMAALERVPEIGMMRAIGAKKSFIGSMFFGETAILSLVFGGIGILFGIMVVHIVPFLHITSQNDMLQLLFGGDTFSPTLPMPYIIITIIQLFLVTLIAVIYPMKVVRDITPLDAIVRD